jgi:hypothetical protein
MRVLFPIIGIFIGLNLNGQKISGSLIDHETKEPLTGAHIQLLQLPDSSSTDHISDALGNFLIERVKRGNYILEVSYIGFENFKKELEVKGNLDLGTISLTSSTIQIEGVEVKGESIMAVQKGDTTQFNAAAFKTNPDATTQDLLKKIPGVRVENGQVQAQGEQVQEVLVNGKPFFGNDPRTALQNIPADVVDQVQIFDQQSEQARFTGFSTGETSKTINIITRRNMNNGSFGRFYGGAGDQGSYKLGGNYNKFNGDTKISLLGMSNNINQQNFSSEDLSGVMAGSGGRGGSWRGGRGGSAGDFLVSQQNGIITTHALGLNYNDKWGNKVDVSGSYFFNNTINDAFSNTNRQFIEESAEINPIYTEQSTTQSNNTNHRFNLRLDYKINDQTSILYRPRLSFQTNSGNNQIIGGTSLANLFVNSSDYDFNADLKSMNFSNELLIRHKLKKEGRTLSLRITGGNDTNNGNSYLLSEVNGQLQSDTLDQLSRLNAGAWNIGTDLSYTEPLGEKSMLQLSYRMNASFDDSDKKTYDYYLVNDDYSNFNSYLSNVFTSDYIYHRFGSSYRINGEKSNFNFELEGQIANLDNQQSFPLEDNIQRNFINLLPSFSYRYNLSRSQSLRVYYRTSTNPPSLSQLQEVIDNSNPLRLTTGNPDLKQQYQHRLFSRYSNSNVEKSTFFFAFLSGSYTNNYIANNTYLANQDTFLQGNILLQRGGQLIKPVNMEEASWNIRGYFTYGMPLRFIKSNLNLTSSVNFSQNPGIINEKINLANTVGITLGTSINSNISEKVDFNIGTNLNINTVSNSVNSRLDNTYYIQTTNLGLNWIFGKGFVFRTDLFHNSYNGLEETFNQNFLLVNMGIGKKFLKDQRGEIRLDIFDLLNQNTSISRNVTEVYLEDVQSAVLQQYFMLSFTYNLRKFNGQNMEGRPEGGFGGPYRMIRMSRGN